MELSRNLELQLKADVYRDSYYLFFCWAFKLLHPDETLTDAPHIKYLCDLLQKEQERIERRGRKKKDIIVNIPPRTSKSLIFSVMFNAWVWARGYGFKFIFISFDEDLSYLNAQMCKDIIKHPEYQAMYGHIFQIRKDSDSKGFYSTTHGGHRLSKTTGGNITGFSGVYLFCDDIQNPKTANSEVKIKEIQTYYTQSLYNRATPIQLALRVNLQQRLSYEDLSGYLLKTNPDKYIHVNLPAELDDTVTPVECRDFYVDGLLDPVRLDRQTLDDFKVTLGSRGYAAQYSQKPSPDEGNIIKKEWFDIVLTQNIQRDPKNEPIHFIIDSAYTDKQENDPTAILTCYKRNNQLYILDVIQVWLGFPELLQFIPKHIAKFQYTSGSRIFVEPKAAGKSIVQQLKALTTLNVVESTPPTESKVSRVHSVTPELESRRIHLIAGIWNDDFIAECTQFPNGKHDDRVDTLTIGIQELLQSTGPDIAWL